MIKQVFGHWPDGREAYLFTLSNAAGMKAAITNCGAAVVSLWVPDRNGRLGDVVLGLSDAADYAVNPAYYGAVVGRVGNRIANAKFNLNGKTYQLNANDGVNHLHGGNKGFSAKLWEAEQEGETLILTYVSPDGEEGYPGSLTATVRYTLTDDNALTIDYAVTCDADTAVNLTNHSYFNLACSGDILSHELRLFASKFTPIDDTLIPTGELRDVVGTPLDFTTTKPIGRDINADDDQIRYGGGFDHNFALDGNGLAARVYEPTTGRVMEVFTDKLGIQFYSGNMLGGNVLGKDGKMAGPRQAFCLETQSFPDAINQPNFVPYILKAGTVGHDSTSYRFSVQNG